MTILVGDAETRLKELSAGSVHCIVTSPPYLNQRDYGVAGQIGLEATIKEYIQRLIAVFMEAHRVLRDDGVLWVNLGDSYAGSYGNQGRKAAAHGKWATRIEGGIDRGTATGRLPKDVNVDQKDMLLVPERFVIAMQDAGWYVRDKVVWHKKNPPTSSVEDRCTPTWEILYMFTKRADYFFDFYDIMESAVSTKGSGNKVKAANKQPKGRSRFELGVPWLPTGKRRKRNVWSIGNNGRNGFAGKHYATFPKALVEPCIRAATSEKGCCSTCGAPWRRVLERKFTPQEDVSADKGVRGALEQKANANGWGGYPRGKTEVIHSGWRAGCGCNAGLTPCVVLDPFTGSGTTLIVAESLGRIGLGVELKEEYALAAVERIASERAIRRAEAS